MSKNVGYNFILVLCPTTKKYAKISSTKFSEKKKKTKLWKKQSTNHPLPHILHTQLDGVFYYWGFFLYIDFILWLHKLKLHMSNGNFVEAFFLLYSFARFFFCILSIWILCVANISGNISLRMYMTISYGYL